MNKVILMGRLTRDPDIRYSQGENSRPIARYTLAVDRRRANADGQREADFIGCVAFDRQAEFAERYLHQGTKIAITGRIQTGSYTNRDGQKVYTTDVIIEEQEFAESKAASENRQGGSPYGSYNGGNAGYGRSQGMNSAPAPAAGSGYREEQRSEGFVSEIGEGFMNIPEGVEDEGLPFN
ncbi:MAG: single-stranded DNA-binding protein [Lachnospiraceae bacterium]|nr:single-stranded DNA-binding protein [Lachnospiraceae bacterium]